LWVSVIERSHARLKVAVILGRVFGPQVKEAIRAGVTRTRRSRPGTSALGCCGTLAAISKCRTVDWREDGGTPPLAPSDPGIWTSSITPTPLPAALPLFAGGLSALGLLGWRRKRKIATAVA